MTDNFLGKAFWERCKNIFCRLFKRHRGMLYWLDHRDDKTVSRGKFFKNIDLREYEEFLEKAFTPPTMPYSFWLPETGWVNIDKDTRLSAEVAKAIEKRFGSLCED